MSTNIGKVGPEALVRRKVNVLILLGEDTAELSRDLVVRHQQTVVVGQRDKVPVEQPMHGSRQRQAVLDDVRPTLGHRHDMSRLGLGPSATVDQP